MDTLALEGEEGRASLREAAGSWQEVLIRGCPNGVTHHECGIIQ